MIWPSCDPETLRSLMRRPLFAKLLLDGGSFGRRLGKSHGRSHEYSDHRPYAPGDEPRHIDWRVLARIDRPYVKRFQAESNLRVLIVIDASGSMMYQGQAAQQTKWDYARALACAVAYLCVSQGDSVGLSVLGGSGPCAYLPHSTEAGHWLRIRRALTQHAAQGELELGLQLQRLAATRGRKQVLLVITDCFEKQALLTQGLAALTARKNRAVLLPVMDRDEIAFPFQDDLGFLDLESGQPLEGRSLDFATEYRLAYRREEQSLRRFCAARRIGLIRFVTDEPLPSRLAEGILRLSGFSDARGAL